MSGHISDKKRWVLPRSKIEKIGWNWKKMDANLLLSVFLQIFHTFRQSKEIHILFLKKRAKNWIFV